MQIVNAQDNDDQLIAANYWEVYLPLDAHRFLWLPGRTHKNPRLSIDHRVNLPGGLALPLNELVVETAHRHVFWHPSHDPRQQHSSLDESVKIRQQRPQTGGK